jgi:hypothetical protein
METIVVDIISGDWKIETAVVQLDQGAIVDVQLQSGYYHPVMATSAEVQRKFWTKEYEYIARTSRVGATVPDQQQMIAKAIGTLLLAVDYVHEPEDSWIDAAFEDRYEMAGF